MAACLAFNLLRNGEFANVRAQDWKWIVLRGAFGSGTALLAWAAVAEGAQVGDASALGSTNVVVASLLGLVVLGERLSLLHILALVFSLAGALLVSKPAAVFGSQHTDEGTGTAWFGNLLALGSGICSGGLFIASRKSQGISSSIMITSVFLQEGLGCWLVAWLGLVKDGPLEPLVADPRLGIALLVSFMALFAGITWTISLGSQLCPAAASSTIFTSVSMTLGYIAQSVVHNQRPSRLSEVGAAFMMLAVALVALARRCQSRSVAAREAPAAIVASESPEEVFSCADHQLESLASFMAAEFSGLDRAKAVRHRRAVAVVGIASCAIGLVALNAAPWRERPTNAMKHQWLLPAAFPRCGHTFV